VRMKLLPLLLFSASLSVGCAFGARPDLSKPPDPAECTALARSGGLLQFRDSLGDALASCWMPAKSGRAGSGSDERFAAWTDLYRFVDLLVSEEAVVTKGWLEHHLEITSSAGENGAEEGRKSVTILTPGSTLSKGSNPERVLLLESVLQDTALVSRALSELVAQPFEAGSGPLYYRLDPEFVAAMVSDPVFLAIWSDGLREEDFAPKAILNLQAIWRSTRSAPSDWLEFLTLAITISVIRDQPPPSFWPHHQVDPSKVPTVAADPAAEFQRWVKAWRDGKLRGDPRRLRVGELKFVVDAPLDPAEMELVRNTPALSRQDPAQAFASIAYDKGRLNKSAFDWPWDRYTLGQIRERGGICVDQAYYAAVTGKALGIPTMFFSGQGKDGGHAWIGYLKGPRTWDFSVARYSDQNFATGQGLDPQSWTPITDHDIELLTRHLGNRDPQNSARRDLIIASDFRRKGDAAGEGRALGSALAVCPENPDHWDALEEWMVRTGASATSLKSHHEAAIRQFSRHRDLRAMHQESLIRIALAGGDRNQARSITEQIVHENKAGRPDSRVDLSARAAAILVMSGIETNDPAGAVEECRRQLQLQGQDGGGDFLYKVVAPLLKELIRAGQRELARSLVKQAREILKPVRESLVDRDLQRFQEQASAVAVDPSR